MLPQVPSVMPKPSISANPVNSSKWPCTARGSGAPPLRALLRLDTSASPKGTSSRREKIAGTALKKLTR